VANDGAAHLTAFSVSRAPSRCLRSSNQMKGLVPWR
jgi:hypothetical protein